MKNEKKILTCVGIGIIALIIFGWNDTARLAQAKEEATVRETKQEIVIDRGEAEITPATVVKTYTESELLGTSEIERDKEDADSERARTYGTSGNGVAGDSELQETADNNGIGSEDSGDNVSTDTGADEDLYEASGDGSDAEIDSGEPEVDGEGYTDPATESEPDTAVVGEDISVPVDDYDSGYSDSGVDEAGYAEQSGELTEASDWIYYGNARVTFYCPNSCCCGEYATGYTASGTLATEGRTVATGEDIPFGTEVMINGQVYIAEDRGVGSGEIDVFVNDHETALAMGMYYTDVYIRY